MRELANFENFKIIKEAEVKLEATLDSLVEGTINEAAPKGKSTLATLFNPVKYIKIKNNAKKYQQSLIQIAINNLDFEKKKAAGNMDKDKAEVLKAANAQKNQALKDQAGAISDRMDQLATTNGLKKVVAVAKNKSKMAAAETALKTADGEEAKALKLKIKALNQKVAQDQQELKDYEKAAQKGETPEGPNQQNLDNVKTDDGKGKKDGKDAVDPAKVEAAQKEVDAAKAKMEEATKGDDEMAKIDSQIAYNQALQKKAKLEGNDDKVQGLGEDIGKLMQKKQELANKTDGGEGEPAKTDGGEGEPKEPTTRPETGKNSKEGMIARYQNLLKNAKSEEKKKEIQDKIDKLQNESEERFLDPEFLAVMESELAIFESELNSAYLNESVSAKFRRLMENKA